jgi:cardiolipin synthase (CMP-forming)
MPARILSYANEITILRLVFVPIFAILVVERHNLAALIVLGAAAASDVADGFVARTFHQQTPLGVALDPIADKALMTTAYLVLAFRGALPWWITIVVISRDAAILLTAGVISLVAGYRPFPPSMLGKASTSAQAATIITALAVRVRPLILLHLLLRGMIDLTAALTAASGLHYLFVARHRFGLAGPVLEAEDHTGPASSGEAPKVKVRVKVE